MTRSSRGTGAAAGSTAELPTKVGSDSRVGTVVTVAALAGLALRFRPTIGRRYRAARRAVSHELTRQWGPGVQVVEPAEEVIDTADPIGNDEPIDSAGTDEMVETVDDDHAVDSDATLLVDLTIDAEPVDRSDPAPAAHAGADNGDTPVPTDVERELSEVLAEVMGLGQIAVTSDFFDDLGADSMVMAHFCARLRKRDDLPSLSIKEVYQHPSISRLAATFSNGAADTDTGSSAELRTESTSDAASEPGQPWAVTEPAPPVSTTVFVLCGFLQLVTLIAYSFALVFVMARGYEWIAAGTGFVDTYERMVVFGGGFFLGWTLLPIVAKWTLIGRWKQRQFRVWSLAYYRFWLVKFLVQASPWLAFAGSPIYVFYLRALGARIGRGTVILSARIPVCTDLLTIGDRAVIRKDAGFQCYRAHAGYIQTGPVTLGNDSFLGESTVLDIGTSLADRAQLGHSSSLHAGQSIPRRARMVGSPAQLHTEVNYRALDPTSRNGMRRAGYSIVQLALLFAVSLPLLLFIPVLASLPLSSSAIQGTAGWPYSSWPFYGEALIVSVILFLGVGIAGLVFVCTFPRLLNLAVKPDRAHPLYGARYWAHRGIARLTNITFFTNLFGDSSYIVHYLYCLGYDVSFKEQTGANFGLNVKHDSPYHVTVGRGTMVADGLSIINADYSDTSFQVSRATIGAHSFLGNTVFYPAQGKTGENCLLATKVMVPVAGDEREGVGFLGSPSFEIPRMVMRDRKFDDLKTSAELPRRLAAKNRHNLVTMMMFMMARWVPVLAGVMLVWTGILLDQRIGPWATIVPLLGAPIVGYGYFILVERASIGFRRLEPLYCSMYDIGSWRVERYWKLSGQPFFLNGTPFKSVVWRLLGIRIGKRVFDDGCLMIDKTLITVGDHCTLNAGSVIQPHSQEDGTFKSDHVTIGSGCTLGVGALVHYGVTMGDRATLAADSFLMKGAEVLPDTQWGDNPSREIGAGHPADATKTVSAHRSGGNGSSPIEAVARRVLTEERPSESAGGR